MPHKYGVVVPIHGRREESQGVDEDIEGHLLAKDAEVGAWFAGNDEGMEERFAGNDEEMVVWFSGNNEEMARRFTWNDERVEEYQKLRKGGR